MKLKSIFVSPVVVLCAGILAISTSAVLARFAQESAPSLVIAAGRTTFASLILLPFCLSRRRAELWRMSRQDWGLALLSGGVLGIHFASWIASLEYTTVATSTVLVSTVPLWVGLGAPFVLQEAMSRPLKLGIGLALIGSVIIAFWGTGQEATVGANPLLGNGLAVIGAVAAAIYFLIGRRLRQHLSLLSYATVVYGTSALFLLGMVAVQGESLGGYGWQTYGLLLLMALLPQLLGHSSFNWALGFLPASYVAVTVISEPIGATLLALFFFGEIPGVGTLIGGVLILAGIFVASQRSTDK